MQKVKNDKKGEKNLVSKDAVNDGENNEMLIMGQGNNENEESSNADDQEKPKIYLVELMFIFPILIVADVIDVFSLTGIGAVLSWAMDLVATGVTTLWLFWKGRRVGWNLVANAVEFIPVVDILPIRTTMMIILLMLESKKRKRIVYKTAEIVDKKNLLIKK
jgi:hypothetical protein